MKTSADTDKVLPAFAAMLADVENPTKNATNPHFRNRYADLGAALECVRPHLNVHDLAMFQDIGSETHDGNVLPFVVTTVIHQKTGQWVSSERLFLRPSKPDPQQAGSALTYARRYSLMTFFGLTAEDDDGNRGSGRKKAPARKPQPRPEPEAMSDDVADAKIAAAMSVEVLKALWEVMPKPQQDKFKLKFAARRKALQAANAVIADG